MPVRPTAALCHSVLTLVAWLFAWPTRADGQAPDCNRACLERALDGYLDALIDRQPARLRIEKGLIVAVESVLHPVPYGMGSGWSTWEETMSSRPRW
jgi:hypothetical protein